MPTLHSNPRGLFSSFLDGLACGVIGVPLGAGWVCLKLDNGDMATNWFGVVMMLAPLGYLRVRSIRNSTIFEDGKVRAIKTSEAVVTVTGGVTICALIIIVYVALLFEQTVS